MKRKILLLVIALALMTGQVFPQSRLLRTFGTVNDYILESLVVPNLANDGVGYWIDGEDDSISVGDATETRTIEMLVYLPQVSSLIEILQGDSAAKEVTIASDTIAYPDFDNAYVNGIDTDNLEAGMNHIVITSATDVDMTALTLGKYDHGYGKFKMYMLRTFNNVLSVGEIRNRLIGAPILYKYAGASNDMVATYDSSQAVSDAATLVFGKEYSWQQGSADSLVVKSVVYTSDTTFVSDTTSGTAYGDLTGSVLHTVGCLLDLNSSGVGHNQWTDVNGSGFHGAVSGALPIGLPADDRQAYDKLIADTTAITLPAGYVVDNISYYGSNTTTVGVSAYFGASDTCMAKTSVASGAVGTGTIAKGRTSLSDDLLYLAIATDDSITVNVSMQRIDH